MYTDAYAQKNRNTRQICLEIANGYLNAELGYGEARHRLARRGSFGNLMAGELALEEASKIGKQKNSLVSSFIDQALISYKRTTDTTAQELADTKLSNQLRANFRLAQLGVFNQLFKTQCIPEASTINKMYRSLTKLGARTLQENPESFRDKTHGITEVKGTLGELAVLALAQRHALREVDGQGWLPMQSLFSEDQGGDCLEDKESSSWDMTIFTQYDPKDPLQETYKIQTKSSLYSPRETGDITTVSIRPDLLLYPEEGTHRVVSEILVGCMFEISKPDRAQRVTRQLDKRTEQMLDVIG